MHLIHRNCLQKLGNCDLLALPTLYNVLSCKQLIQARKDGLDKRPTKQGHFGERRAFGNSVRMHCDESLRSWSV